MLAYYYNRAAEWGQEVVVTYKWHDLAPGAGLIDLELADSTAHLSRLDHGHHGG